MKKIRIPFAHGSWEETSLAEYPNESKLTQVVSTFHYSGELTGTGELRMLMFYRPDGKVTYSGYERITGTLDGKTGTAEMKMDGVWTAEVGTDSVYSFLHGEGDWSGITGTARHLSGKDSHAQQYLEVEYSL